MMSLPSQRQLIKEKNWDFLFILDACRYDYFERVYRDYLDGNLYKVVSSGTGTPMWLQKTFNEVNLDDVVYVSGTPFVNSLGISPQDEFDFTPTSHFFRIIDAWKTSKSTRIWSGHARPFPRFISKKTILVKVRYPNKRIISHFMQPHYPFLCLKPRKRDMFQFFLRKLIEEYTLDIMKSKFKNMIQKFKSFIQIDKRALNRDSPNPIERIARKYGEETLRTLYEKNLRIALKEARALIERLSGKIIITSDHGELLGEDGLYWHSGVVRYRNLEHPILREVPWFEINFEN